MSIPYIKTGDAIKGYNDSQLAKSERADCVVRAIASAYEMEYDLAHKFVTLTFGRKPKRATFRFIPTMNTICDMGTKINKKITQKIPDVNSGKNRMSVGTFAKWWDKGTYIINVSGHAFTIKDGQVIGNPNDSTQLRKIVKAAWRIR
jgi:hypothetical protein